MTKDERLHYLGGWWMALPWRWSSEPKQRQAILEIDRWAFDREWAQNEAGQDVNDELSEKQLSEARAWGQGARRCLGLMPALPQQYAWKRPTEPPRVA